MKYISTRGQAPVLNFEEAMLTGLARDGGLYLPENIPQMSHGDTAALEELLVEGLQETPGLYEAILTDRNRNWVPQIARLAEEPGTHLVVVGTMHLVGKDSVLALLEAQGISSRQLSAE